MTIVAFLFMQGNHGGERQVYNRLFVLINLLIILHGILFSLVCFSIKK